MSEEVLIPDSHYTVWGPFIPDDYHLLRITRADIITAGVAFGLASFFALCAAYIAIGQTRSCRQPWRSAYVWMIWLELAASVAIAIECLLYLLRIIRPSFYLFMSICKSPPRTERIMLLTECSVSLDNSGPASTPDHHQPDSHHHA